MLISNIDSHYPMRHFHRGSSPFWFKKRCELYLWINHHVQVGNGAPTFFITLSCAENYWVDILEKIRERMLLAGEDTSRVYAGAPGLTEIVNKYSIVVQEYFQKRVVTWLEMVGKRLYGIKHYWIRYEFAPNRGQIHAHLLAIPHDHKIYELCHADLKKGNGKVLRAQRLAHWVEKHLGLVASID